MAIEVERVEPADDQLAEEWIRKTHQDDIQGVGASRWKEGGDWPWQVEIWVAEFLREEPLQSELFEGVGEALRGVAGVTDVVHEDRETWVVAGTPRGEDLVRAGAGVVDRLADRARAHVESLAVE